MSTLYVSAGFIQGDRRPPRVRVKLSDTGDRAHIEIDALALLVPVETARELAAAITTELGEPS